MSAEPVSSAAAADFALSRNETPTIAAGSTTSTGTVTVTAADHFRGDQWSRERGSGSLYYSGAYLEIGRVPT